MRTFIMAALSVALSSPVVRGEDWPQWLGPQRDGVWRESHLVQQFPQDGPKVRWRVPVKGGYGGPAVADGKVIVMDWSAKADAARPRNAFDRTARAGTERVRARPR